METVRWIGFGIGIALVLGAAVSIGKTLIVPRATPGKIFVPGHRDRAAHLPGDLRTGSTITRPRTTSWCSKGRLC